MPKSFREHFKAAGHQVTQKAEAVEAFKHEALAAVAPENVPGRKLAGDLLPAATALQDAVR